MIYRFNQEFYAVDTVTMEMYDSKGKFYRAEMTYDPVERQWTYDTDMEVVRYKYVVNDVIRLNDQTAGKYVYDHPFDIYIGVDVCRVKGLHSLTYICFQPDGRIYMIEESSIGQFEENEADYEVVFKNRISRIQGRNAEGMWTCQVYLDGKRIIKDYFVVKRKIISDLVLFDCKM